MKVMLQFTEILEGVMGSYDAPLAIDIDEIVTAGKTGTDNLVLHLNSEGFSDERVLREDWGQFLDALLPYRDTHHFLTISTVHNKHVFVNLKHALEMMMYQVQTCLGYVTWESEVVGPVALQAFAIYQQKGSPGKCQHHIITLDHPSPTGSPAQSSP